MDDFELKNYVLKEWGTSPAEIDKGLNEVVKHWESIVGCIAAGEKQYFDDFFLDMHCRATLNHYFTIFGSEQMSKYTERIAVADKIFKEQTYPTKEYLQGSKYEKEIGISREKDWWFYYRPKNVGNSPMWPELLEQKSV
jgi:hypothetical protein